MVQPLMALTKAETSEKGSICAAESVAEDPVIA